MLLKILTKTDIGNILHIKGNILPILIEVKYEVYNIGRQ